MTCSATETSGRAVATPKPPVFAALTGIPVVEKPPTTPDRLEIRTPSKAMKIPTTRYVLLREMLLFAMIAP